MTTLALRPFANEDVADAVLATQSATETPAFRSFDPDDLFFRKTTALQALVLVLGQSELQTGLSP